MIQLAWWASLILIVGLAPRPANAQVKRLPPIDLRPRSIPARLASHPDSSAEPFQEPGEPGLPPELMPPLGRSSVASGGVGGMLSTEADALLRDPASDPLLDPATDPIVFVDEALEEDDGPPGRRKGVFQKINFKGAWMPAIGDRGFGMSELRLDTVFALPCPTPKSPLLIIPGFAVHYFDDAKPAAGDYPPRVYDAFIQFRWFLPVTKRLTFDLSFTPGVYSDFEQSADEAIRYAGHGFAAWDWTPKTKLVLGVVYVDREDVGLLPGAGLIWTPHDDLVVELLFPRPRIAQRIRFFGGEPQGMEHWVYLAGEYAGDTWAIRHPDNTDDELNYRDFRLIAGVERKVAGGVGSHLEVAYVLGRKFQFDSARPDFKPADTLMLRGGLSY